MSSKKNVSLQILMNGYLVGRLHSSAQGVLSFDYEKSWLDFDNRRPLSLSLPLSSQSYSGVIVENYFDNLLPDSLAIRSRLQARVGAETTRCFDLLSYIGRDSAEVVELGLELGTDVDADVQVTRLLGGPSGEPWAIAAMPSLPLCELPRSIDVNGELLRALHVPDASAGPSPCLLTGNVASVLAVCSAACQPVVRPQALLFAGRQTWTRQRLEDLAQNRVRGRLAWGPMEAQALAFPIQGLH